MIRFLPFTDLAGYSVDDARVDVQAAAAVTFLSVPQAVAYAVIAGLPPHMGLYAAAIPCIVGALLRSSRHVVAGPSNALSLLVGMGLAAHSDDPVTAAATLALMVGVLQIAAGWLSLGAVADLVSGAVVLGYVAGAGVLIAIGQLPNATATPRAAGNAFAQIQGWLGSLADTHTLALALAVGTVAVLLAMRKWSPRLPGEILVMAGGIALSWALDLQGRGVPIIADLAPVPTSLPPFEIPSLDGARSLLPLAFATTVLSLLESAAVARSIASRTRQPLDTSVEFAGQGWANLAAAFTGGFPVSGSLARSALNETAGAKSRMAGVMAGLMVLAVLLAAAPLVDLTPISVLAGVLFVVASRLVDVPRIRRMLAAKPGDRLAFVATLVGTWTLPLDRAIYLGVAISIVLFLRRARLLVVTDLGFDPKLRVSEIHDDDEGVETCPAIALVHVEGSLFFGASTELMSALEERLARPEVKVLILRLKRVSGLDVTTASVIEAIERRMREEGRTMLFVGMSRETVEDMKLTGLWDRLDNSQLFPTRDVWFAAMEGAVQYAADIVEEADGDASIARAWLQR